MDARSSVRVRERDVAMPIRPPPPAPPPGTACPATAGN